MFSKRLKFALQEKGFSQVQLATELGLSSQAINRWCQNLTQPDNETIVKIAKILNVSTDFLLGNDTDYSKQDNVLKEKMALKNVLVEAGYMKENEDLSKEELERLMKFVKSNKEFIKNIK